MIGCFFFFLVIYTGDVLVLSAWVAVGGKSHENNGGIAVLIQMGTWDFFHHFPKRLSRLIAPGDPLFTYLQVFNLLFQLFSTHESLRRRNGPFSFLQPFLKSPNQLPEFI